MAVGTHIRARVPVRGSDRWRTAAVLLLALSTMGFSFLDPVAEKNREGNQMYREGKFDRALEKYREAQLEAPEALQPHFNAGDALFRQDAYAEAAKEYGRVAEAQGAGLVADASYNLGNAFFRSQRLQEAVAAYKQALLHRPDDVDAKANLELAQSLLDQQESQQQEGQDGQGQAEEEKSQEEQQEGEDQEQDTGQSQGEEDQQDQEQMEQSDASASSESQPRDQQRLQQAEPQEGKLTPQEAERLLGALEDREREAQKRRKIRLMGKAYTGNAW
ncbi:MAG: tetratricopeptide repeat protein [Candidatus Latescibacteria bacterium]|nr:tetratricopeptide repeat protein [Candidatus Latescibacterota bacterium]